MTSDRTSRSHRRALTLALLLALAVPLAAGCSPEVEVVDAGEDASEPTDALPQRDAPADAFVTPDAGCASPRIWYRDDDGDSYGDDTMSMSACEAPLGYAYRGGDCDDANNFASPSTREICDGVDNNCNDMVDDGLTSQTYYRDADGDNFGDSSMPRSACSRPDGYASNGGDCLDSSANTYPGAPELCDTLDNNCDMRIDDGVLDVAWYVDGDADGYGNDRLPSVLSCRPQEGRSQRAGDCNDTSAATFPGAMELCDRVDSDCSLSGGAEPLEDFDGDGFSGLTAACMGGFMRSDCNDMDASTNPGVSLDGCGGGDNDCDMSVDEDLTGGIVSYADADSDTYGRATGAMTTCSLPPGRVTRAGDCNDMSSAIRPGAAELCNNVDDDCSMVVDDNISPALAPRTDNPVGVCNTTKRCIAGAWQNAYAMIPFYEASEVSCDARDNNCNGQTDEGVTVSLYTDSDRDTYGADPAFACPTLVQGCPGAVGFATRGGDTVDSAAAINPGAAETCDGRDENSNGAIDEGTCPTGQLCSMLTASTSGCRPCTAPPATLSTNIPAGTDLVWCPAATTVDVPAGTTVLINGSLTLGAGIRLRFGAGSGLSVLSTGVLRAQGTAASPVTFTSSAASPTPGAWGTIRVANTAGARVLLNYTIIEYASAAISQECCGVINRSAISDSILRLNRNWTSGYSSGAFEFWRTTIEGNLGGNQAYDLLRDCTVRNNPAGGVIISDARMRGGVVSGNDTIANQSNGSGTVTACRTLFTGNQRLYRIDATECTIARNFGPIEFRDPPTITQSNICNNGALDVRNTSSQPATFTNNYWCTTDTAAIATRIYDQRDDGTLGLVTFTPLRTSASPTAPAIP